MKWHKENHPIYCCIPMHGPVKPGPGGKPAVFKTAAVIAEFSQFIFQASIFSGSLQVVSNYSGDSGLGHQLIINYLLAGPKPVLRLACLFNICFLKS